MYIFKQDYQIIEFVRLTGSSLFVFTTIVCIYFLISVKGENCLMIKTKEIMGKEMCEKTCDDLQSCAFVYYDKSYLRCHLILSRSPNATENSKSKAACSANEQLIHLKTRDVCIKADTSTTTPGTVVNFWRCTFANCSYNGEWHIRQDASEHSQGCLLLSDENRGLLQVYHNKEWGTVCDDNFRTVDAEVACRCLGYSSGTVFQNGSGIGRIWLDNVGCHGTEKHLFDCPHGGWGIHDCRHSEDVGLICN